MNTVSETDMELHEHQATVRGLVELRVAQNRDVHLLAMQKLLRDEEFDEITFASVVQDFAQRY